MRIEVLVNPVAGRRRFRFLAAVLDALRARADAVRVHETRWRGDAEEYAREAASRDDVDRLVVAGGDGTIGEAINGLGGGGPAGAALPLGVIPMGTANVLAGEIGLPRRPAALAAVLAGGAPRRVSLGVVATARGRRRFAMMASVGLDAEVVAAIDPRLKRALGKAAYALTGLRLTLTRAPARYAVTLDGGARVEAGAVIAANGRRYGGGFVIAPEARLDRSELQIVTACGSRARDQLRYAAALALGRFPRLADVEARPARRLALEGPDGAPVQADGDLAGELPATIELLPDALTLVFPR